MKKAILMACIFAVSLATGQTQVNAQSLSIGPRVGVNFANWNFSDANNDAIDEYEEDRTSSPGFHVGAVVNVGVSDMFSIQPELLFSQKGIKYEYSEGDDEGEEKVIMNYVEVPVLAKVSFGGDNLKFFVNAGPYVGFALSGKQKSEYTIDGETENEEEDLEFDYTDINEFSHFKRLDAGFAVGAGVGLQAGPGMLNIEARYGYGLNDIVNYEEDRDQFTPKISNRVLGVSVAYLFSLGD